MLFVSLVYFLINFFEYNLHTLKCKHFKSTVQWDLTNVCTPPHAPTHLPNQNIMWEQFHHHCRLLWSQSLPPTPAPGSHWSTFLSPQMTLACSHISYKLKPTTHTLLALAFFHSAWPRLIPVAGYTHTWLAPCYWWTGSHCVTVSEFIHSLVGGHVSWFSFLIKIRNAVSNLPVQLITDARPSD